MVEFMTANPHVLLSETMTEEQQVELQAFGMSDNTKLAYGLSIQAMVRRTPR